MTQCRRLKKSDDSHENALSCTQIIEQTGAYGQYAIN